MRVLSAQERFRDVRLLIDSGKSKVERVMVIGREEVGVWEGVRVHRR